MSAQLRPRRVAIALVGTGLVGRALVDRLRGEAAELAYRASSRLAFRGEATREGRVSPQQLSA
ncbi:MAG TPA: hypothetical protein VFL14_00150, partial [Xanthomonadales bacterium]|nr:hypothetical protein [Xanthomonadales bacterium]